MPVPSQGRHGNERQKCRDRPDDEQQRRTGGSSRDVRRDLKAVPGGQAQRQASEMCAARPRSNLIQSIPGTAIPKTTYAPKIATCEIGVP
jgi:hypothetical protein